jgi:hypothetical protein
MTRGREYLVHHGIAGHLGRFRALSGEDFARGSTVVVRGRGGLELGDVLLAATGDRALLPDDFVGELLRPATDDDLAAVARNRVFGQRLFDAATQRAEALAAPISFVDVEVALDGASAVLHGLRHAPGDVGPLLAELGEQHSLILRLYEVNGTVEEDDHGCGSCGSEGGCGSCGTGGCSSCSSGAGKELASYFAELRGQMENRNRVALL